MIGVKFNLNTSLYHRDPQDTQLGRKIIKHGIDLMNEVGFEAFNFKKLAKVIQSAEASMYRYFENKHMFLLCLTSLYWEWVHYLMDIHTVNISDGKQKLAMAIETLVLASDENATIEYINEELLHQIVINESAKAYHTIAVDAENKIGLFQSYQEAVQKLAHIINQASPDFPYHKSLASNLFEMANNQIYFAQHLPQLTDIKYKTGRGEELQELLQFFAFRIMGI